MSEHFKDYFSRLAHNYSTRGNYSMLNLPRMKSEAGLDCHTLKKDVFNNTPRCVLVHTKVCTIAHKGV